MGKKNVQIGIKGSSEKGAQPDYQRAQDAKPGEVSAKRNKVRADSAQKTVAQEKRVVITSMIIGLGVLIGILLIALLWVFSQSGVDSTPTEGQSSAPASIPIETLELDKARDLLEAAIAINTGEEVERYFDGDPIDPDSVLAYLRSQKMPAFESMGIIWQGYDLNRRHVSMILHWNEGLKRQERLAVFRENDKGVWKIDYPAFACLSEPQWQAWLVDEVRSGTVRAIVNEDSYFNGIYQEDTWLCFRLRTLNNGNPIYSYVRKGSPQAMAMERLAEMAKANVAGAKSGKSLNYHALLRLERADDSLAKQYEIKRVLASDWVEQEAPYDQQFMEPAE